MGRPPPSELGCVGLSCMKASLMFSCTALPSDVLYVSITEMMLMMIIPKTPSQPTACIGGTLYFVMSFSSTTIWKATTTCATTMMRSPSNGLDAEADPPDLSRNPDRPTNTRPPRTSSIPPQWYGCSFRPSKTTESRPVKMTTDPRSIWKLEACVIVSPMYMAVVAHESHIAGIAQTSGLNFCGPSFIEDSLPPIVEVNTMSLKTRRHENSPTNMVKAWTKGWLNWRNERRASS
mmetsp:Transcript_19283/g.50113  ORF Transcript_19283/g.50113 Transcript_19283/m.50113 type:complete len:234 (+) Transcript_19283:1597-2298(+)